MWGGINIDFQLFMNLLGVKEEYQIQTKLMEVLFVEEEKNKLLDSLIDNGLDISQDIIRDMFECEVANRKTLMQDYTPDSICKLVSELSGNCKEILDVCSGVGSLSIRSKIDNHCNVFVFEEISEMSISLLILNSAIRNIDAIINRKDIITKEIFESYKLTKSNKYSSIEKIEYEHNDKKYDCIISNPPYSMKWEPINDERFWNYGVAPKSKADYVFVLDILYRLSDKGKAYIILPHGVLFRSSSEGEIRKALIYDNLIDAVIGLPDSMFMNTSIPTIVLCLNKNKKNKDVLFIDSSKNFIKDRKQNIFKQEHIDKIIETLNTRKEVEKYSHVASFEELQENEFNLNIPRYVDTSEEKEPVDLEQNINEIMELETKIHEIDGELALMLAELQGPADYELKKLKIIEHLTNRHIHDVSECINNIMKYINSEKLLKFYKVVNLLDYADIERSKKDKVYPKGSILIQLSATKGQIVYLEDDQQVDAKYGIITPKNINSRYLYFMLQITIENFLKVYQDGLNIVPDVFKFYKLKIHDYDKVQNDIVTMFDSLEKIEAAYAEEIEKWNKVKEYHLDNMFI